MDPFITQWFRKSAAHSMAEHGGRVDSTCETCLSLVAELLIELGHTPQEMIDTNTLDLRNPNIDACMRVLIERGIGGAERPLKGGKRVIDNPATQAAEDHSRIMHGDKNAIDVNCDGCMEAALRIVESVHVSLDEFLADCDVTGRSRSIAEGIRAYQQRTNKSTNAAPEDGTSAWDL